MKKFTVALTFLLFATTMMAQVPSGFSYQAVVRNTAGDIVANKAVKFRFSILQNSATGTAVYVETQSATTNSFGLANLKVGMGTKVSGNFDSAAWGSNKHYLKVELDPNNGTSFYTLGTEQLLSVPYAFHSQTVQEIPNNSVTTAKIADNAVTSSKIVNTAVSTDKLANSAVTAPKLASMGATAGQVLTYSGTAWAPQTIAGGTSQWLQSGSDIYFNTGKVGIGKIPGTDLRQFQVLTEANQAIAGVNNSASYATIFGQNLGAGPAADFRNYIRISDGTQGAGKVLTSDANGYTSWSTPESGLWQKTGNNIYYNNGIVGIGTNNPAYTLDIRHPSDHTMLNIKAVTNKDAILYLDKGSTSRFSTIGFCDQGSNKFYVGLLTNNNFRISTSYSSLGGMEITSAGAANFSGRLNINLGVTSGVALFVNSKEAIWFDGTYYSWGFGGNYNYFADPVTIATSVSPGYTLVVNGTAAKTGGGSWSTLSDIRMKDLKGNYTRGLSDIMQLNPVKFTYKTGNPRELDADEEQIGFVAQDVMKVFPEAVNVAGDGFLDFNMHSVNVALVNAVRELKTENDRLTGENERLKAKDTQLESRLERLEQLIVTSALK